MDQKMPNFSLERWEEIVDAFYHKYHGLKRQQDLWLREATLNGFVRSPSGRMLSFDPDPKTGGIKRTCVVNYPVQSFATADIMPLAMGVIHRSMRKRGMISLPVLQVHDSLVFDAPKEEVNELASLCMTVFNKLPIYMKQLWNVDFNLPLTGEIEVGDTYGSTEKYEIKA